MMLEGNINNLGLCYAIPALASCCEAGMIFLDLQKK